MKQQRGKTFYNPIKTKLLTIIKSQQKTLTVALIAIVSFSLTLLPPALKPENKIPVGLEPASFFLGTQPAAAQRFNVQEFADKIYKLLPDLPLENSYINRQTKDPDTGSTLISRLIRYHIYVKGRPPIYRLDWKLTLADYLGVNEIINKQVYPGQDILTENPLENDRAALSKLNRAQRDALIEALVKNFNPNYGKTPAPTGQPAPQPTPQTAPQPAPQPTPQTGGANLLK